MNYTLLELAKDIKNILKNSEIKDVSNDVCLLVSRAVKDDIFVTDNLTERSPNENPREVLYEDEELGFCICGHVYQAEANGMPHDHGSSWAIYGQAEGETEMTDWEIVNNQSDDEIKYVKPKKTYTLKRGDVHYYAKGEVHSPVRKSAVKILRIEGVNLDYIKRSNIKNDTEESHGSVGKW